MCSRHELNNTLYLTHAFIFSLIKISFFQVYLCDRTQVICTGLMVSLLKTKGVPQGSMLGPLLFVVYINNITPIQTYNIHFYADDTILYAILFYILLIFLHHINGVNYKAL